MSLRKLFLICTIITVIPAGLAAQVFAPEANAAFPAKYNEVDGTDKVFIFNLSVYRAGRSAAIYARSVDSTSGWTFQWAVYDHALLDYTLVPGTILGDSAGIDTISVSSGYRVEMTKDSESHTFNVWVLFNDLEVFITNKDEADTLLFGYYNCNSLDLRADTTKVPLFYFNPATGAAVNISTPLLIRWTTDNDAAASPPRQLITRVTSPPWEDTWYKLTVTDNFGLQRSDSVFYESIQSKAIFTAEYVKLEDSVEYAGKPYGNYYYDETGNSAPGKFSFNLSESRNMASYEIDFGDGEILTLPGDSLKLVHVFKLPGEYNVVFTTKSASPDECTDSATYVAILDYATAANFSMPNAFTPARERYEPITREDYENQNLFRTNDDVSVTYIEITIFNRAGLKVHAYDGNIRDWEGWDGKVKESDRDAPEGVYFYVISVFQAYEDRNNPVNKKLMTGFVHLFRE